MKNLLLFVSLIFSVTLFSQPNVLPAAAQTGTIALTHATIHVGNGDVINDGTIVFSNGKIISVNNNAAPADAKVIDCSGKQIYPGVILADCNLGLEEIEAIRSEHDDYELGDLNPDVRSVVAYNTDSKIINTLRSNGVLLAHVVPDGGILSGTSSVMQLDAWNWEDAVYKLDNGIHFRMPSLAPRSSANTADDVLKKAYEQIDDVRKFFREAKAYLNEASHATYQYKI